MYKKFMDAQKLFPNFDDSVTLEDIDRAIYKIEQYLDRKKWCTDRDEKLRLIKRLNKLRGRSPHGKS